MAVDMFIKIGDIKGESVDSKHANEIDVLAWSWGASQSGTTHTGPGGGSGKVNVQDLSITKYIDKATPALLGFCFGGKHITSIVLTARKAGGTPVEFVKVTMEDAIITAVSQGGSGGEDRFTENVTINFAKVKFEYTGQKKDGSADTTIPHVWDIAANKGSG
jgi:type VI secretion system secreted protein Hcp